MLLNLVKLDPVCPFAREKAQSKRKLNSMVETGSRRRELGAGRGHQVMNPVWGEKEQCSCVKAELGQGLVLKGFHFDLGAE